MDAPFPNVPNGCAWPNGKVLLLAGVPTASKTRIQQHGARQHEWRAIAVTLRGQRASVSCKRCLDPSVVKTLLLGCTVLVGVNGSPIRACASCFFNGFGGSCDAVAVIDRREPVGAI